LLLLTALPLPAAAEVTPRPGRFDPRVRTIAYNPLNPVRITASPTSSTQLLFAAAEEVTHVAIGDPDAWLAQPAGNHLFLKPLEVRLATNAQVVTRRPDGSRRSYQLVLAPTPTGSTGSAAPVFAVSFTYPQDAAAAAAAERARTMALNQEQAAQVQLARAWAEGPRNWRYVAQGSAALEPSEVSDNGQATAFRFPGGRRLPVIYTAAPDGQETIVPYALHGDVAVVQATAPAFVLRDGQAVLRILNRGFDPLGRDPGTGTGTPDLTRFVRGTAP
jgi:type IV secretion system protein VirB9